IGEPAAKDDHVRVEDVDHDAERAREAVVVAVQVFSIALEGGTAKIGFDAVLAPAIARPQLGFPRHRVVPPLPGNPVYPLNDFSVDNDPPSDAGAEDDAEDDLAVPRRAV